MSNFNINKLNIFIMSNNFLIFIVAMSIIVLAFYVFKKTFESRDETEFEIQNRLIGRIRHKKKSKKENDAQ